MTKTGRLPISAKNIWPIAHNYGVTEKALIQENSRDADLAIIGFGNDDVDREGIDFSPVTNDLAMFFL